MSIRFDRGNSYAEVQEEIARLFVEVSRDVGALEDGCFTGSLTFVIKDGAIQFTEDFKLSKTKLEDFK